jgi:hypothetical protein
MEDSWINVHGKKLGTTLEEFGVCWSLEDELCEFFSWREEAHVRRRERFWWLELFWCFVFNYILF